MIHIDWKSMDAYTSIPLMYRFNDVIDVLPGEEAWGRKAVSTQDWYFPIHFPGNPVMPGVFLMEMMLQAGEVVLSSVPDYQKASLELCTCDSMRIFSEVHPGDLLETHVKLESVENGKTFFSGDIFSAAERDKRKVCKMDFSLAENDAHRKGKSLLSNSEMEEFLTGEGIHLNNLEMGNYIADPLPYRFNDSVSVIPGRIASGRKHVSSQEWYFNESMSAYPAMPTAYMLESILQTGVFIVTCGKDHDFTLMMFNSCKKLAVFRRPVPGDAIRTCVRMMKYRNGIGLFRGSADDGESVLAEMEFILVAPDDMLKIGG